MGGRNATNTSVPAAWREFELAVAATFARKGYAVAVRGGRGADGRIDIVLTRGKETALVQCKQWRAMKVSVETVRELHDAMVAKGASRGYVVTLGKFTADAVEFARGRNIELVDGEQLVVRAD
jgi:restriction system protein